MRHYDLTMIFSPHLEEGQMDEKLSGFVSMIQDRGGILDRQSMLGRKPLPGVADGLSEGYVAVLQAMIPPEKIGEIQKALKNDEGVFRYSTTIKPKVKEVKERTDSKREETTEKPKEVTEEEEEMKRQDIESIDEKLEEIFSEEDK